MRNNNLEDALVAIRRIMRVTEINSLSLAKKTKLTPTQMIVLQVIATTDEATPSFISNKTTLGYATITTVLNKLVTRGLITRKKGDLDRRMQFVKITEKGQETIELAPDMLQSQFEKNFQNLHDWEQSMIVACLQRVSFFLEAETIDAAPILDYGELNQIIAIRSGVDITTRRNSLTVLPLEMRAMNMPTKGDQDIHQAQ